MVYDPEAQYVEYIEEEVGALGKAGLPPAADSESECAQRPCPWPPALALCSQLLSRLTQVVAAQCCCGT